MGRRLDASLASAIQGGPLAIVLIVWHVAAARRWVSPLIVPEPARMLEKLADILGRPETYHHLRVTASEFGGAMLVALAAGLAVGIAAGAIRYLGDLVEPVLMALYAVPIIMAFPLCILFFGIGSGSKIVFGGAYAFFPIAIQTIKGLRHVDPTLIRAAVCMGAGPGLLLARVQLPAAAPVILTGVRLGAVLGLLSVVAGEMLGALEGVGQMLTRSVEALAAAEAFAWILVTIGMVVLVSGVLSWIERRIAGAREPASPAT